MKISGGWWVAGLMLLAAAVGCTRALTPPVEISARPGFGQPLSLLLILPAEARTQGPAIKSDDLAVLTEVLRRSVSATGKWEVRSSSVAVDGSEGALEERAGVSAAAADADAALVMEVFTFRERVGGDYGVKDPASVAFRLLLVPAGGDAAVWQANYAFTQLPLSENLWNLWGLVRGGIKWLTAREIATIGVDESIDRLSKALR
jgi:hypothetical protein